MHPEGQSTHPAPCPPLQGFQGVPAAPVTAGTPRVKVNREACAARSYRECTLLRAGRPTTPRGTLPSLRRAGRARPAAHQPPPGISSESGRVPCAGAGRAMASRASPGRPAVVCGLWRRRTARRAPARAGGPCRGMGRDRVVALAVAPGDRPGAARTRTQRAGACGHVPNGVRRRRAHVDPAARPRTRGRGRPVPRGPHRVPACRPAPGVRARPRGRRGDPRGGPGGTGCGSGMAARLAHPVPHAPGRAGVLRRRHPAGIGMERGPRGARRHPVATLRGERDAGRAGRERPHVLMGRVAMHQMPGAGRARRARRLGGGDGAHGAALPSARVVEIAGAGHDVHLDRPEAWREALEGFLSLLDTSRR